MESLCLPGSLHGSPWLMLVPREGNIQAEPHISMLFISSCFCDNKVYSHLSSYPETRHLMVVPGSNMVSFSSFCQC